MVEPQVIGFGESESGFRFGFKGQKNIFPDFSIFERGNRKVGFRTQKNIFFPRFSSSRLKKGVSASGASWPFPASRHSPGLMKFLGTFLKDFANKVST